MEYPTLVRSDLRRRRGLFVLLACSCLTAAVALAGSSTGTASANSRTHLASPRRYQSGPVLAGLGRREPEHDPSGCRHSGRPVLAVHLREEGAPGPRLRRSQVAVHEVQRSEQCRSVRPFGAPAPQAGTDLDRRLGQPQLVLRLQPVQRRNVCAESRPLHEVERVRRHRPRHRARRGDGQAHPHCSGPSSLHTHRPRRREGDQDAPGHGSSDHLRRRSDDGLRHRPDPEAARRPVQRDELRRERHRPGELR